MTLAIDRADPCHVRLRFALCFLLTLPLLAGCSGADAGRAQALLQQAQEAQKAVSSESFSAHLAITATGQTYDVGLSGGAYVKGARAGDMVMDVKLTAPIALPFDTMRIAKVGTSAWMETNGKRTSFPIPAGAMASPATKSSVLSALDFTQYIKDVKVQGGQLLNGKPATKIVGVLDTGALFGGLTKLRNMSGGRAPVPNLGETVGDTRVVLFIDDTTHLLVAALADLSFKAATGDVKLHLDLAISGVNEPVAALPAA
jgi:hypothetical protein